MESVEAKLTIFQNKMGERLRKIDEEVYDMDCLVKATDAAI